MNRCNLCQTEVPEDRLKCQNCGNWVINASNTTTSSSQSTFTPLLCDVKSAEDHRIDIGPWNRLWGGLPDKRGRIKPGLVDDSVTIIGGMPGAGKSTLFLQLMDIVCTDREGLYIATEESLEAIKARADRLEVKNQKNFRMVPAMTGGVDINNVLSQYKPKIGIIDSLAGLAGEDDGLANTVCKICKDYAVALKCPFIISHHVTKGQEIAGLNTLQHMVDTVITVFPDDDEPNIRMFEVNPKNRHGQAFLREYFMMTAKGLQLTEISEDEDDEDE